MDEPVDATSDVKASGLSQSTALRYIPIGFSAFLIDFGLLKLGIHLGWPLILANTFSTAWAIVFSFLAHRFFTFRKHMESTGYQYAPHTQAVIFLTVSLIAILLNDLIITALTAHTNVGVSWAKIITSAIMFVWNYAANRAVTFRGQKV